MLLSRLLLFPLIFLSLPALAEIYKQVDERGNVTYTDTPSDRQETEKLDLPTLNTQPALPTPERVEPKQQQDDTPDVSYRVHINAPAEGTQVPMGQSEIPVSLSIQPGLKEGFSIQILLNGQPFGEEHFSNFLILRDVYRGEHQLEAIILDASGQEIARSDSVTIYVQRSSIPRPAAKGGN